MTNNHRILKNNDESTSVGRGRKPGPSYFFTLTPTSPGAIRSVRLGNLTYVTQGNITHGIIPTRRGGMQNTSCRGFGACPELAEGILRMGILVENVCF